MTAQKACRKYLKIVNSIDIYFSLMYNVFINIEGIEIKRSL